MLQAGDRVGNRYTVESFAGRGSYSEVYRANDEVLGRAVALKVLRGTTTRQRREAEAVAGLDHPNIVSTFDVDVVDGTLCLVQEWIEGASLETILRQRQRLDIGETLRVGRNLAAALAHAHRRGILHRDLKPSNVLFDRNAGFFRLIDFGAVGRLQADTLSTRAGDLAGTPLYMSPEQVTGAPQTAASDVFGLGLLLLRSHHGPLPGEDTADLRQFMLRRIQEPIAVPWSPLRPVLLSCLALEPEQRYPSAAELLEAIEALRADLETAVPGGDIDVEVGPATGGTAAPGAATPVPAAPGAPAPPPSPAGVAPAGTLPGPAPPTVGRPFPGLDTRRSRRPIALAVLAVLGVVALVTIVATIAWLAGDESATGITDGSPLGDSRGRILRILAGVAICGGALSLAHAIRARWSSRSPEAERRAASIVLGSADRADLTRSLAIEVDELVRDLASLDKKILGLTVLAMVHEYESGKESSDRQAALLNVVTLMEKLQIRLAPWHIRNRDSIALAVAVVGCLTGVVSAVTGVLD